MVEQSRQEGYVLGALNSNFTALIPKINKHVSFNDYRPISLCNLSSKVITKIISNNIKPIMEEMMTKKYFVFLVDRHILDSIGVTQEVIHSIKNLKMLNP